MLAIEVPNQCFGEKSGFSAPVTCKSWVSSYKESVLSCIVRFAFIETRAAVFTFDSRTSYSRDKRKHLGWTHETNSF